MTTQTIAEVEALVVTGFFEDKVPVFRQGLPEHELEDVVTAKGCEHMANTIERLTKRCEVFRSALVKMVGADDPTELRTMLVALKLIKAPDEDKAAALGAIEALLEDYHE